ncbi:MAG: indolepyruvate oxidoreductase subunit beta [Thermoplasmata archaeon]|nr:indolepyruvate oxidoreductase subunit beta [Thermoplasmata archaeon]
MRTDIFLAGVGGQGILSFARVLGVLGLMRKMNVVIGETHGMAQRGGSVTATVRYGDVYGSIIGIGKADLLVGFEPLEAARYARILSPKGTAIVSTSPIVPYSISATRGKYPETQDLIGILRNRGNMVIAFDANEIAEKVKFILTANSALLGAVASTGKIDAQLEDFRSAIKKTVPRKAKENLAAFDLGYEIGRKVAEEQKITDSGKKK